MIILKFIVEANIGAGKSSLISTIRTQREDLISALYEKIKTPVKIYCEKEPTREWEPFLKQYYTTYSNEDFLRLQLIIYTSLFKRENLLSEHFKMSKDKKEIAICFLERDMDSGENFFYQPSIPSKDSQILKEVSHILRSNSWFHKEPKHYIFIDSEPETCLSRIQARQNSSDSQIPLSLLLTLNERYQKFFTNTPHFHLSSNVRSQIHENSSCMQQFILPIILDLLRKHEYGKYSKN